MSRLLTPLVLLLAALLPVSLTADVITVDGGGGGDYLTIQEAIDAASTGDTVLVYPGTYTDTHDCWYYGGPVNVCIYHDLTLESLSGPDSTVIGSGDHTSFGVLADAGAHVVVRGFTVTNGSYGGGPAAIGVTNGEVRGNVCAGFGAGIINDPWWYAGNAQEQSGVRDGALVVADNTVDGGGDGIYVRSWVGYDALVSGNRVHGSYFAGIRVYGLGSVSLVDNEISGSVRGVRIRNSSNYAGSLLSVDLRSNTFVDNLETNVEICLSEVPAGSNCLVTLGGAPEDANDIFGAPINLKVSAHNVDLQLDATYNYWGSVACSTFVPFFDIHEGIPDTAFVFEPFVDEAHVTTYDCQGVPVQSKTWGGIKSLYR